MCEGVATNPCLHGVLSVSRHGHLGTTSTQVKVQLNDLPRGKDGPGKAALLVVVVVEGPTQGFDLGADETRRPETVVGEADVVAVGGHELLQLVCHGEMNLDALLLGRLNCVHVAAALTDDVELVVGAIRHSPQLTGAGVGVVDELVENLARDEVPGLCVLTAVVEHIHLV